MVLAYRDDVDQRYVMVDKILESIKVIIETVEIVKNYI
jgi:hypothetical protein